MWLVCRVKLTRDHRYCRSPPCCRCCCCAQGTALNCFEFSSCSKKKKELDQKQFSVGRFDYKFSVNSDSSTHLHCRTRWDPSGLLRGKRKPFFIQRLWTFPDISVGVFHSCGWWKVHAQLSNLVHKKPHHVIDLRRYVSPWAEYHDIKKSHERKRHIIGTSGQDPHRPRGVQRPNRGHGGGDGRRLRRRYCRRNWPRPAVGAFVTTARGPPRPGRSPSHPHPLLGRPHRPVRPPDESARRKEPSQPSRRRREQGLRRLLHELRPELHGDLRHRWRRHLLLFRPELLLLLLHLLLLERPIQFKQEERQRNAVQGPKCLGADYVLTLKKFASLCIYC